MNVIKTLIKILFLLLLLSTVSVCFASDDVLKPVNQSKFTPQPLAQLVKEENVLVVSREYGESLVFDHNIFDYERSKILGTHIEPNWDADGMEFSYDPKEPFPVNIYCLDGQSYETEIINIKKEMKYIIATLKQEPSQYPCILVNGAIEDHANRKTPESEHSFCEKSSSSYFCKSYKGDLNNDGSIEVLVNDGWSGSPHVSKWHIYVIDQTGKPIDLGNIGNRSSP